MKNQQKANTEKSGKNVRYEHGTVIKPGFWFKVLLTNRTIFMHLEGFFERKGPGLIQVTFVAFRTFKIENTIGFCAFPE